MDKIGTVKLSVTLPRPWVEWMRLKRTETGVPVSQQIARLLQPQIEKAFSQEGRHCVGTAKKL